MSRGETESAISGLGSVPMKNALRALALRILTVLLFLRSKPLRLLEFQRVLVVAPHPDDEALGCGGTLALLAQSGLAVHVLFITDGGASHPKHPTMSHGDIATARRAEAARSLSDLGVGPDSASFLGVTDGTLGRLSERSAEDAVLGIASTIVRLKPDAVLLPFEHDGSSEHDAAFGLVSRAILRAGIPMRILEFPIWSWWNPRLLLPRLFSKRIWRVDVSSVLAAKTRAVLRYETQLKPIPPQTEPSLPRGFPDLFLGRTEFLMEG